MEIVNMGPIFYPAMADQGHSQSETTESVSESKYFIDTSYPHGIEHQSIHHTYEGVTYIERIWHLYTSCYPIINIAQWEGLWNHKTCKVLKRQHLHHHPAGTCRHNHTINAVAGIALMQRRRHRSAKCPPDRKPYTTKYSMFWVLCIYPSLFWVYDYRFYFWPLLLYDPHFLQLINILA